MPRSAIRARRCPRSRASSSPWERGGWRRGSGATAGGRPGRAERGAVGLDGRPLASWRRDELAQFVALVPQREDSAFSWRVEEMVGFGRYARLGPPAAVSPATPE